MKLIGSSIRSRDFTVSERQVLQKLPSIWKYWHYSIPQNYLYYCFWMLVKYWN